MKVVLQKFLIKQIAKPAKNLRCQNCGSLLGKFADLDNGTLQIKCRSCGKLNDFKFPVDRLFK